MSFNASVSNEKLAKVQRRKSIGRKKNKNKALLSVFKSWSIFHSNRMVSCHLMQAFKNLHPSVYKREGTYSKWGWGCRGCGDGECLLRLTD